ncbi:MAG: PhoPQ-activated pathogenicity-like protein PqaA type [Balneolaceae bacterium]|nr:MAG: PhoPQ-activated pathogenicity-like protein PqaA type [Balneolaceae bacterium]
MKSTLLLMKNIKYLLLLTLFFIFSCRTEIETPHPFEAYLAEPHPAYQYELKSTIEGEGYTAYVIRMVSQEWLSEDLVNETEWWHWLTIVVPDVVEHNTGMLWIGGGTNYTELPTSVNPMLLSTALATNSITADLHNVPFQPISFLDDGRLEQRYEDDLIAYGWRKYLEGGAKDEDAVWLARLPMTAAAIRALDTTTDFASANLGLQLENFVVGGASKRGWTTWTTGIFDHRVIAIIPVVIDMLNVNPSFEHHWQALGEWSPAIKEYVDENIMEWQASREFKRMLEIVDPYSYLDRLTMPKFIINGTSDEFFLPDSWQFYWHDLQGDKYLRYVPNYGHSLSSSDAGISMSSFYNRILTGKEIPAMEWQAGENTFTISFDPDNLPDELLLWNAHNPEARDFRLYVINRIWVSQEIDIPENGQVTVQLTVPDDGYTAWFVEATFDAGTELPMKQTTGVVVTPDTYPADPYVPFQPRGTPLGM